MASHPGPQPQPFVFPREEAMRLQLAAEALSEDIGVLTDQAQCAMAHAAMGFRGSTRVAVDAAFDELMLALWTVRRRLDEQADQISGALQRAAAARDERDAQILRWHGDLAAYRQAHDVARRP